MATKLALALVLPTLLVALAPVARAQDSPPRTDTPSGASAGPAPAPVETTPPPAPAPTSSPAPKEPSDIPEGLWLGSRPDVRVEAGFELFYADFKSRSHFGFKEHAGRGEETAFVQDAGWPSTVLMEGGSIRLNLGVPGWLGADVLGFGVSDETGLLQRERQTNSLFFEPGDVLRSHGQILWAKVYYGFEVGYRFELGGIPVAAAASPYLGFGMIDEDVRVRRVTPNPTNWLGGHMTSFNVAPGLRGSVDFFDHAKIGFDVGLPGGYPINEPRIHTSDRYAVYLGLHAFHVELDLGWKLVANHLLSINDATDMRFRGWDVQLRVSF